MQLDERVGCKRLPAVSASTIMRFTTVSPGPERNIIIPAGTRVTADSVVYFATTSTVVIQAGNDRCRCICRVPDRRSGRQRVCG